MASLTRTMKRARMFKGMNAKQKRLRRYERKNRTKEAGKNGDNVRVDR